MVQPPGQRDPAAIALTQHQRGRVTDHLSGRLRQNRRLFRQRGALIRHRIAIAQTGPVKHQDAVTLGQRGGQRIGHFPRAGRRSVDQNEGRAFAHLDHVHPVVIHVDEPAIRRIGLLDRAFVPGRAPLGQRGQPDHETQRDYHKLDRQPALRRVTGAGRSEKSRSGRYHMGWSDRSRTASCHRADAHGCASGSSARGWGRHRGSSSSAR